MQRWSRTIYALLGFLTWRPMSGYDLKKAIEQSTSNFWSESYGQIYPVLQSLVRDGLARRVDAAARGGRERQEYEITARGRTTLRRWLNAPTAPTPIRSELLLKLFFGRRSDPSNLRQQIAAERARVIDGMAHLKNLHDLLVAQTDQPDAPYWLATLLLGELQSAAQLKWCDEVLALLARLPGPSAVVPSPTRRGSGRRSQSPQPRKRRASK